MNRDDDVCPGCGLPADRAHAPLSGCPVMVDLDRAAPTSSSRESRVTIAAKLRDVLTSAYADVGLLENEHYMTMVTNTVIDRLKRAEQIELDDGTLFVRRRDGQE